MALIREAMPGARMRIAECMLAPHDADALVHAALRQPASRPLLIGEIAGRAAGTEEPAVGALLDRAGASWKSNVARARSYLADLTAIATQTGTPATVSSVGSDELRKTVARHHWVQMEHDARWLDLDPSIGQAGQAHCTPSRTWNEVPQELQHRVRVSLIAERRIDNRLTTQPLFEVQRNISELRGQPFKLMFVEDMGLEGITVENPASAQGELHTPVLMSDGSAPLVGQPIELPRTPDTVGGASLERAFGGISAQLDQIGSGAVSGGSKPATGAEVTSVTLRVAFESPGGVQTLAERMLFDRIGFVARASGQALTAQLQSIEAARIYDALGSLHTIAIGSGVAPQAREITTTGPDAALLEFFELVAMLHGSYDTIRRALLEQLVDPMLARQVTSAPALTLLRWAPQAEDHFSIAMDILIDPHQLTAVDASRPSSTTGAALGIAAVMAENMVVESVNPAANVASGATSAAATKASSILGLMDRARSQRIKWRVLSGSNSPRQIPVGASADARARVTAHVQAGRTLLIPEQPVSMPAGSTLGWWLIDEARGAFFDELETGARASTLESASITGTKLQTRVPLQRRYSASICKWLEIAVTAAVLALPLFQPGDAAGNFQKANDLVGGRADAAKQIDEQRERLDQSKKHGKCKGSIKPP